MSALRLGIPNASSVRSGHASSCRLAAGCLNKWASPIAIGTQPIVMDVVFIADRVQILSLVANVTSLGEDCEGKLVQFARERAAKSRAEDLCVFGAPVFNKSFDTHEKSSLQPPSGGKRLFNLIILGLNAHRGTRVEKPVGKTPIQLNARARPCP
ncbi:hypothetical protein NDU88_002990 [Pleurodeles waltl]|uniref:Uncharacterized protein n=1 Tax=Pleurodeles waltl TaxID=8319 RepID=A0AAV7NHY7_PLEWA|nr:hypothetical protein NDU88_002990 [Pleurodeles waltl]